MKFKDTKYGDLTGQHYDSHIDVTGLGLTSLEGAPKSLNGWFICKDNQLTTLEGAPKIVGAAFSCSGNKLTNLKGAPNKVDGNFFCNDNKLTNLKGAPEKLQGSFDCSNNKLTSLEDEKIILSYAAIDIKDNPNKHLNQEWKFRKANPDLSPSAEKPRPSGRGCRGKKSNSLI